MKNGRRILGILLSIALVLGLMAGMNFTASAETVYVSVSTFSGLSEAISEGKNVKLTDDIVVSSAIGVSSAKKIILDGNGHQLTHDGSTSGRAFNVNGGSTLVLKNLTVTGFVNDGGGAILNSGTLVLDKCKFSGNSSPKSGYGGGAIENSGKLYATGTVFDGNFSGEIGGVINNYGGSLYLTDCIFKNNYTTSSNGKYGGAIGYNSSKEARIINCSFSNNYYGNDKNNKSDLGLFRTPNPYSIAGCGTITIMPSGEWVTKDYGSAVLDYSDLSNILFTYSEHSHSFTYSAEGPTITANCAAGCPLGYDTNGIVLTLSANNATYTGSAYTGASLDSTAWTAAGLTVPAIEYSGRGNTSYTKSTTAPINAGDYTASVTVDDKTATADFTIAPVTISSVAVTDITAPVATEALDTAAITSTANVTLSKVTWTPTTTPAAYATRYTATVIATAAANYAFADNAAASMNGETATVTRNQDGTLSISYTFEKTALTPVTITAEDKEAAWSTNAIAIPVDGMFTISEGAGAVTCSVTNGTGEGTFAEGKLTVTKCGTFTVKLSTAATDTHAAGAEAKATLTVNKVDSVPATVTANNHKYDGTDKPLVTVTGEATGGKMQFALGTATEATGTYATSIPTATDAGTYFVWYKVAGDENHNDSDPACATAVIKGQISATVTFKVVNGSWNDGEGDSKTVTLTGYEGDQLKLTADQIPAVGDKPAATFKAGTWDVVPSTETVISQDTTYTYTYVGKDTISATVTFKVVNGSWNDGEGDSKTVTLTGYEGDQLKLTADQIPAIGDKPDATFKAGTWDVVPSTETVISQDTTYTYTYAGKDTISATVTFKVVNGSWNDGEGDSKTVTLTGYEGDPLKLTADQIPAIGDKPAAGYKAGSWDTTPSTDIDIKKDTAFTYTYAAQDV